MFDFTERWASNGDSRRYLFRSLFFSVLASFNLKIITLFCIYINRTSPQDKENDWGSSLIWPAWCYCSCKISGHRLPCVFKEAIFEYARVKKQGNCNIFVVSKKGKMALNQSFATDLVYTLTTRCVTHTASAVKKYHLLTKREVITGKSQTEAFMYWPSDSEVDTSRPRSEISL